MSLDHSALGVGLQTTPVVWMLGFVEGDRPHIEGSSTVAGPQVPWPKAAADPLLQPGELGEAQIRDLQRTHAIAFPPA